MAAGDYNTTTGAKNKYNTVTGKLVSNSSSSSSSGGGGSSTPVVKPANDPSNKYNTTTGAINPNYSGYVAPSSGGGSSLSTPINIDSNPGQTLNPGQTYTYQGQTYTQPGAAVAPTNPANITQTPDTVIPTTTPDTGNISDANGVVAGVGTSNDAQIAQINQINADRETAQKTNETILSKLMSLGSTDSTAQTRQDLSEQYGIQAKIAEIDSLTTDYNKIKAAKDQQVAKTQDVMGSMNFINNQTQQIERNAAPQLNELSANINSKAAILSQNQDLVNQAVQDATADKKYQMDLVTTFYQMNQDTINNLDSDYKLALQNYIDQTTTEYKQSVDTANQVMQLGMTYTKAGIKSTDTLAQAYAKIQANPYTLEGANTQSLINDRNKVTTAPTSPTAQNLTDLTFKSTINGMKTDQGAVYEDVVQEINADPTILNKDRGIQIAKQIYGVKDEVTTTPAVKDKNAPVGSTLSMPSGNTASANAFQQGDGFFTSLYNFLFK